ncbi:hypothetical protein [Polyangium jinanense]|uniref:6-bladed beta-propeller n=1 Tax=Polyangium jinanense TaxID=2829994 RepID=A0A9X3X5A5_9BACT|nr:hypothetical protein [Polyangium jinanense]MDC3955385.1 hypothetical protein [Polyangium jinanense]MDC3981686.1 hypothetical protein [Polyangium jinanense]
MRPWFFLLLPALVVACGSPPDEFGKPTDVFLAPNGELYVSDGYENTRVARFDVRGMFLDAWGDPGSEPGHFDIPHGIASDGKDRVYVADRGNARLQIFDLEGMLVDVWSGPEIGRPWGVEVAPNGHVFVIDGGDQLDDAPSGRALELDRDGKVITSWGSFGREEGQFDTGHDITVGPDGSVYVVEQVGRRVQKFRPKMMP